MVQSLSFIKSRLEGAQILLHATHDYVKWQAPLDVKPLDSQQTFKVSCEAMRITVRLTQIMGWLLLQQAVLRGEISREETFKEECRVLRGTQCLERGGEEDEELPLRLRELLRESRELYMRVLRLDEGSRKLHKQTEPL